MAVIPRGVRDLVNKSSNLIKKRLLSFAVVWVLVVGGFIGVLIFLPDEDITTVATVHYVGGTGPGNYSSIQNAIDAAAAGDSIFVYNGIYYENLVISKTISIIGQDKNNTIIDGSGLGKVMHITDDWVNITNLHITNGSFGLYIESSSNNKIINNIISFQSGDAIYLISSSNNIIKENNISNNDLGIHLFELSSYNIVENNNISNNEYGMYFRSAEPKNNEIKGNKFISNDNYGIHLFYTYYNNVTHNNFSYNGGAGIELSYSTNNNISHNYVAYNYMGIYFHATQTTDNLIHDNDILFNEEYGIRLGYVKNTNITNNRLVNDGVYIYGSDLKYYNTHTIPINNMVNGKPLHYIKNLNNINIDKTSLGQLILVNCKDFNVKNLTIDNTDVGLELAYTTGTIVSNNNISKNIVGIELQESSNSNQFFKNNISSNSKYGLYLSSSDTNDIQSNNIFYNKENGIRFYKSNSNNIINNYITNNENQGIYSCVSSTNNQVHYNNIYENLNYSVLVQKIDSAVDATYNWWGNKSGPFHPLNNTQGTGDNVSDHVSFIPWLDMPFDNQAPTISLIENKTVFEDSFFEVNYNCTDINGDKISWSEVTNAEWLKWGNINHTHYGTPRNDDVGSYWVNIKVADCYDHYNEYNFTINVTNVDLSIMNEDITTAYEDVIYFNDYNSTDDGQGIITWDLGTNASWLNIDKDTGILSGIPGNDDVGGYWVNVSTDDGNGGTDFSQFVLYIINTNDVPYINTVDITTILEDEYYEVVYTGTDIDSGDVLRWSQATNANWLNWGPLNNTLYGKADNEEVGEYWARINLSDGNGGFDEHYFNLTVINVNDAPKMSGAPTNLEVVAFVDKILNLTTYINDIDNEINELSLITDSEYANINGLIISFNYPNSISQELVEIIVSDGDLTSIPHYILVTVIGDYSSPTILEKSPTGVNIHVSSNITVTFSESMDQSTVEQAFSITPKTTGTFSWIDFLMIFNPFYELLYNTTYSVTIVTTATDLAGNYLDTFCNWSFTTVKKYDNGNPFDGVDSDNDGYLDTWEEFLGTNPHDPNDKPLDIDGDGLPDGDITNSQSWMDTDDDNDELSDSKELEIGTDPLSADTDGDGYTDSVDAYPLDSSKWKKEEASRQADDLTWLFLVVIVVVLVVIIIGYLLIIKPRKELKESVEEVDKPEPTVATTPDQSSVPVIPPTHLDQQPSITPESSLVQEPRVEPSGEIQQDNSSLPESTTLSPQVSGAPVESQEQLSIPEVTTEQPPQVSQPEPTPPLQPQIIKPITVETPPQVTQPEVTQPEVTQPEETTHQKAIQRAEPGQPD